MFRQLVENALNEMGGQLRALAGRYPWLESVLAKEELQWLMQSTAFALAVLDERQQDDVQDLLRPLLAQALPECLRPRPAMTVLELPPATTHAHGVQGTVFEARTSALPLPLPFRMMWPVMRGPYEIRQTRVDRVHANLQVLRIFLSGRDGIPVGKVIPERVRFFVQLASPSGTLDLLHALRMARDGMEIRMFDADGSTSARVRLPPSSFRWVRVDTDESPLVSAPADRFISGTLLRDLFVFPESFFFFEVALESVESASQLELSLPLAHTVDTAGLTLRLFCAPATNEFPARIVPLRAEDGPEWDLEVAQRPDAEILHVQSLSSGGIVIDSLEAPAHPIKFRHDDIYFRLRQNLSYDESRTETRLLLASPKGFNAASPARILEGEVLASDGSLTESIGVGDVDGRNVTRVSPSGRAVLGRDLIRLNAFARMSAYRLAQRKHLIAFLRLHAPSQVKERLVKMPDFEATFHRREPRMMPGGVWQQEHDFLSAIATPTCSKGEAWIIGHILSRALSEHAGILESCRFALQSEGETLATYDTRQGSRYSPPFG